MKSARRLAISCFAYLSWLCAALAAEPPTDPILRIDAGRHSALISKLATDAKSRWLVSASWDKTLRIWDLQSGGLLKTLYPPLGEGDEGRLSSVAMSPDGTLIATGGSTGRSWDKNCSIYIFERSTGRMLQRIGSQACNAVSHLSWSYDGLYLAAAFGGLGIHVFRREDYSLIGQDKDYAGTIEGLDVSRDGRLATTSRDGNVRLYRLTSAGLQLLAKNVTPGGKQPWGIRFSPDGSLIAVGYRDGPNVNLLAGDTLAFKAAPSIAGIRETMSLNKVAWSSDGANLYAGGTAQNASGTFIRVWSQSGLGDFRDIATTNGGIADLLPLERGGAVYATLDPTWGVIDAAGQRTTFMTSPNADFRNNWKGFLLSPNALAIRYSYAPSDKSPARFSLLERSIQADDTNGLLPPLIETEGIAINGWLNTRGPTLNGRALPLKQLELSYSVAVAPDNQSFVLGTGWFLRRFDRTGRQVWERSTPGAALAVNVSANGRFVVAAYHDGTIRWHRLSDGGELLALYPHADKKRWVLWTPSGYYDASPGAEDLFGWHLNRGKDSAADFFPASRFRNQFYRPDVIARIVEAGGEEEALRLADNDSGRKSQVVPVAHILPPVVEIVSPKERAALSIPTVTIKYNVRSPEDAPVTALRLRVNGQAVSWPGARNLAVTAVNGAREVAVPIPHQDSEIHLFAENRNGVSIPAVVHVTWAGAKLTPKEGELFKPKLYVLAVGVSKYANSQFNLGLAAKDANDIATVFQMQKGRLYADVQIRLLTDEKATKDDVLDGLEWLKREVTARDVGVMFLAGHGMNDNTGKYFFMPHNADPDKLLRTGVAQSDIKDTLNTVAGKAVFFVDTCHSGNALGTAKTRAIGTDVNAFVNELASAENGVVVFTAATGSQSSLEDSSWGNGAFTKAVVEGLNGKADYFKNGKITNAGLELYVAERVKELTAGRQSPVRIMPNGVTDFPIAIAQ